MRSALALLVAAAALAAAPCDTWGRASSSRVEEVKQLYDKLFYDDALKVCQAVLDSGHNSRRDLVRLLTYKGLIEAVSDKRKRARNAFKRVLVLDPLIDLGKGHPPRVQRDIAAARKWFKHRKPLMIELEIPEQADRKGATTINLALISDPLSMVKRAMLHVRAGDAGGYKTLPVARPAGQKLSWRVKPSRLLGGRNARELQLYVSALDANFNEVAVLGTAREPRRLALSGAPAPLAAVTPATHGSEQPGSATTRPWYKRWWIWAVVGAVVTTTAIAAGAASSGPEERVDAPISIVPAGEP
jgi:hypothetical protein